MEQQLHLANWIRVSQSNRRHFFASGACEAVFDIVVVFIAALRTKECSNSGERAGELPEGR